MKIAPLRYFAGLRNRDVRHGWRPFAVTLLCSRALSSAQAPLPADINLFGNDFPLTMEPRVVAGRRVMVRKETAPRQIPAGYSQTVIFRDGHELRGETVAVTQKELVWKRPDAGEALHFPLGEIRRVATDLSRNLDAGRTIESNGPPTDLRATVKLTGTDWIFGEATSEDGKTFAIRVADWTLRVERSQMAWLYFGVTPAPAFGIGGSEVDLEKWERGLGAVGREGKSLKVEGGWLGRGIVLPARFMVSIEVPEDGEQGTRLWLQPFGTRPDSWGLGTTQIQMGRTEISHMFFVDHIDPQKTPLPEETREEKGPVRYRLFWDGNDKRVRVLRNGRWVGDWKYAAHLDFQFEGICLDRVDANDTRMPLKLNRLSVEPWNGVVSQAEEKIVEQDRWSTGGQSEPMPGKLQALSNRAMKISMVTRPLEVGTFLELSGAPRVALGDIQARVALGSRGEFNVRHLVIRGGKLECETAFAKKLEVPLAVVSSIAFQESPHLPSDPAVGDMLVFKNGDELPGKAIAAGERDVRWRTSTGQEVVFQPGCIAGIRLADAGGAGSDRAETQGGDTVVESRSGERLVGKLLDCDDLKVRLENPLLGTIALPRTRLRHLYPRLSLQAFGGASGDAGWAWGATERPGQNRPITGAASLIALNGTYIARTGAGAYSVKPNELPGVQHTVDRFQEQFEVRFDAISPGESTSNFMLILHGDNEATLTLDVSWWRLFVRVASPGVHGLSRRSLSFQDKTNEPDLRRAFRLFVNTNTGTCDVMLNGTLLTRIGTEARERIPKANYRVTVAPLPGAGSPTLFSNLWVGPWNGQLPKAGVVRHRPDYFGQW